MKARRRIRRFTPPPYVLFERAARIERRACELSRERQSRRILVLGREIARGIEEIADEGIAS